MNSLAQLDPQWAWQPYEPSAARPWNKRMAAHLHRRAGFGASTAMLTATAALSPQEAVSQLFAARDTATEFTAESDRMARSLLAGGQVEPLSAWWLYRMRNTPDPLREKLTLFWHGHFATSAAKVDSVRLMLAQYRLFAKHALGPFEPLVQQISRDPAMLIWLDSTTNRKTHPNENYARELLELFCLGVGNYTEHDIREVARSFTGWEVQREQFHFSPLRHDAGDKKFLGSSGPFNGDEAVRVVLAQPSAPRFIARKLVRYLVCDEPELPAALLEPLAEELRANDFHVGVTVRTILSSNLFFSEHAVGRKIRSPVEHALGLLNGLEGTTNFYQLADALGELGQGVFFPPNVKGWDGGRTWLNASTLLGRANLARKLTHDNETRWGHETDLASLAAEQGANEPAALVDWLGELLLAVPLSPAVRSTLVDLAKASGPNPPQRVARVVHALAALPEYQLN